MVSTHLIIISKSLTRFTPLTPRQVWSSYRTLYEIERPSCSAICPTITPSSSVEINQVPNWRGVLFTTYGGELRPAEPNKRSKLLLPRYVYHRQLIYIYTFHTFHFQFSCPSHIEGLSGIKVRDTDAKCIIYHLRCTWFDQALLRRWTYKPIVAAFWGLTNAINLASILIKIDIFTRWRVLHQVQRQTRTGGGHQLSAPLRRLTLPSIHMCLDVFK